MIFVRLSPRASDCIEIEVCRAYRGEARSRRSGGPPVGPQVTEQMRELVGEMEGVEKVHPKMVFDPPWSPEVMSEDAKFALGS